MSKSTIAPSVFDEAMKFINSGDCDSLRKLFQNKSARKNINKQEYEISHLCTWPGYLSSDNARTLLMKACAKGDLNCVQTLIECGAAVNLPDSWDSYHESALSVACGAGNMEIVNLLLSRGAKGVVHGESPLVSACFGGHLEIAKLLIERGASLDAQSGHDASALQAACSSGNIELVEFLINRKADLHAMNKFNSNCLLIACGRGNIPLMELLLRNGADVNACSFGPDATESTCLHLACKKGNIPMIELLLIYKADMTAYNRAGLSPFIIAYKEGNKAIIDLFFQHEIDLNSTKSHWSRKVDEDWVPIEDQRTPLMFASAAGDVDFAKLLLQHGAEVNIMRQGEDDSEFLCTDTALLSACRAGQQVIVQLLIELGADVNLQDDRGNSTLMTLLLPDKEDDYPPVPLQPPSPATIACMRVLLEHGADVTVKNKAGKTVFDLVKDEPSWQAAGLTSLFKEYVDRKPLLK